MSEQRSVVMTAVGPDRPGLVHEISLVIHRASANLEDSRMAILGGEFALILLMTGTGTAIDRIRAACPDLEKRLGLSISMKETERASAPKNILPYRIRVSGVDRPGIVACVSTVLAGRAINVASLESRLQYAPESGTPLFVLTAELQVPSAVELAVLENDLSSVCEEEDLDFELERI